jgi:hypothetical protein
MKKFLLSRKKNFKIKKRSTVEEDILKSLLSYLFMFIDDFFFFFYSLLRTYFN